MHQLSVTNTTALKKLSNIARVVDSNHEELAVETAVVNEQIEAVKGREQNPVKELLAYSDEYFYEALKIGPKKFGYPYVFYACNTSAFFPKDSKKWHKLIKPALRNFQDYLGGPQNSLACFYPPGGYIGWHNNGNAPGYNTLLTYNPKGKGYFKYYNQHKKEFDVLQDSPGWNLRFGYFPSYDIEPENAFWHTAYTDSYRLTIAFVVGDRAIWENIIGELTGVQEIPKELLDMGPSNGILNGTH